jgi:oligoribonuclease NrnB/cAMP/cGMP phosphodiesterase (DHH superfamily)
MNKKSFCVFHGDLDGIVSYLVLCWFYNYKIPFLATTPSKLETDFNNSFQVIKDYEKVYFLGLDVTKIGSYIDSKQTVIFDNVKNQTLFSFQNAFVRIYNETSCAKLVYDSLFKTTNKTITNNQKTLIALADDWSSQSNRTPLSRGLNIIYHSLTNKFNSFIEDYFEGFVPFDKFKENTITLYKKHCNLHLNNLKYFSGIVTFEEKPIKVVAVFSDKYIEECCEFIFNLHNPELAIVVMLEQKRIAVRRNKHVDNIDVRQFVQKIASGGGSEHAAGGYLTEEFQEFTKLLSEVKN